MCSRLSFYPKVAFTLPTSVILSGCISLNTPNSTTSFNRLSHQERQIKLQKIKAWHATGALSIQAKGKTRLANFSWSQQHARRFQIKIASSLNLYVFTIKSTPEKLTFNDQKQLISGNDSIAMTKKILGYPLPLANLYYWARGLCGPGICKRQFNAYGQTSSVHQAGWSIRYLRYTAVHGVDLPALIDIQTQHFKIRMAIKQWEITP